MGTRFVTALGAVLLSFSAVAADLPSFADPDKNADGALSHTELEALEQFQGEDSDFVAADENDDGAISPAEYQTWTELESTKHVKK